MKSAIARQDHPAGHVVQQSRDLRPSSCIAGVQSHGISEHGGHVDLTRQTATTEDIDAGLSDEEVQ